MYVGVHMRQRHRNDSATEKKEWKKWLDIEPLSGVLCLRYCRSLNGKISASTLGEHLYRDTMNFARVVNY